MVSKSVIIVFSMDYHLSILDLTSPSVDQGLYVQCLKLRQEVFVAEMGWNLRIVDGCEFDQYDTPAAVHVVARSGSDDVVGCMRLLRTDNDQGTSTYMILDAHRGRIPNLPHSIMSNEVANSQSWEASRLAISSRVDRRDRNSLCVAIVERAMDFVSDKGGHELLGLMNPVFERLFKRAGLPVERFGPVHPQRDGDICVLKLNWKGRAITRPNAPRSSREIPAQLLS